MANFQIFLGEMWETAEEKLNLSDFLETIPIHNLNEDLNWAIFEYDGLGPGPKDIHVDEYRSRIIESQKPDYLSWQELVLASSLMRDIDWFLGVGLSGERGLPEKLGLFPRDFASEWFLDHTMLQKLSFASLIIEVFDSSTWAIATRIAGHAKIIKDKLRKYLTQII